jgi:hypothetical protein
MHVSATDCENNGGYGVYTNCAATQPGWQGAPNFSTGMPYTDTVEVKVPFSKIGFSLTSDTMGISFVVTNTATTFKLWPASANKDVPSTWGKAVFAKFPVGVNNIDHVNDVIVSPNPVHNVLDIQNIQEGANVVLTDLSGKIIFNIRATENKMQIITGNYPPGSYILVVDDGKKRTTTRITKQ